jgi:hypothetical protein
MLVMVTVFLVVCLPKQLRQVFFPYIQLPSNIIPNEKKCLFITCELLYWDVTLRWLAALASHCLIDGCLGPKHVVSKCKMLN